MSDKRLIDANAKLEECQYWLYRNSLALEQGIITREHAKHEENAIKTVCGVLSHAPTIDAVEVVRCRVCIHRVRTNSTLGFSWCGKFGNVMRDADFCSWGERKMDGGAE